MSLDFLTVASLVSIVLHLVMLVLAFVRRGWHSRMARLWAVLMLVNLARVGGGMMLRGPWQGRFIEPFAVNWEEYGLFAAALLLLWLAALQYHMLPNQRQMLLFGAVLWPAGLLANFLPGASAGWIPLGRRLFDLRAVIFWFNLGGWVVFSVMTAQLLLRNYRQARFPTLRYRIFLWLYGFGIVFLGGLLRVLVPGAWYGLLVEALGMTLVFLAVAWPRLPQMGRLVRNVLNEGIWLGMQLVAYAGVYLLIVSLLGEYRYLAAAIMALAVMLVLNPVMRTVQGRVERWLFGEEQDVTEIVRQFGQSVSNVLDVDLLSKVLVELTAQVFDASRALIFLVELEVSPEGERTYHIRPGGRERNAAYVGRLPVDSPLASVWARERRAVIAAELEMLPRYYGVRESTRAWISRLGMDVFIPVHARDEWIGLIALGPKRSGASYYAEDIDLLHMLADQTAVVLQNARLVESLLRINSEFRNAYAAMEEAHERLTRIDRTKSDFISVTSHELRTPLTVLSGYVQMLQDEPELQQREEFRRLIQGIAEGAERLHEIVESMLDVTAIDLREFQVTRQIIKLEDVLRRVCRYHAPVFRERKQQLEFDPVIAELPPVLGDPEALRKAFYQLVNNAVKYTPDGGTITITGREIPAGDAAFPQGGVEILVRDTGIGIDPRYHELIFEKFYQIGDVELHSSGKTKFKGGGPGLGLAIVRGVVEAHGGKVWVESPGHDEETLPGSTFHVVLPRSE